MCAVSWAIRLARPEQVHVRRRFVEQQTAGAVENRACVLHAVVLKRRDQREVELRVGMLDAGVVLKPFDGRRVQIEDRFDIAFDLRRVRFPVQHGHRAAVSLPGDRLELARNEGKRHRG